MSPPTASSAEPLPPGWAGVPDAAYLQRLLAAVACAGDGCVIGRVVAVYTDAGSGRPSWVGVRIGTAERLVPLAGSWLHPGARLVVVASAPVVEAAPRAPGGDLARVDEDALQAHYAQAGVPVRRAAPGPVGALVRRTAEPPGTAAPAPAP